MNIHEQLLEMIRAQPGTSRKHLCNRFQLSRYRVHRALRHIDRELEGETVVWGNGCGVWIVVVTEDRCLGMDWLGADNGGFCQCSREAAFPDRRCWEHSDCSNPEMTYFLRRMAAEAGPAEPSVFGLSQISKVVLDELLQLLLAIVPWTKKDEIEHRRFLGMLRQALAFIRWRELLREQRSQGWIPPEFEQRHRSSSVNPFEFSVRKHFTVLEVTPEASRGEVLEAWKRLARKYHPDTGEGDEERMKTINSAKERIFKIRRWD